MIFEFLFNILLCAIAYTFSKASRAFLINIFISPFILYLLICLQAYCLSKLRYDKRLFSKGQVNYALTILKKKKQFEISEVPGKNDDWFHGLTNGDIKNAGDTIVLNSSEN
jgi:hypothetical protein